MVKDAQKEKIFGRDDFEPTTPLVPNSKTEIKRSERE
jgi:hypothetical protein